MSRGDSSLAQAFERGTRHHQAGELQQAALLYREVLSIDPRHADSRHRLGVIALQIGDAATALSYFDDAIKLQPRVADYHNHRGMALRGLGRLSEAEAALRKALRLREPFPEALCHLGTVLLMLGRFAEAEACGRKAVRLAPDAWEAQTLLGHALAGLGRDEDAVACYRTALRLRPDAALSHNNLGHSLSRLGRHAEAEPCYRDAIRLDPKLADAQRNLGCCLKDLGRPAEAESHFREALRLQPDYVEAHINLADTLYLLGRPTEAETCGREAVRLSPASPEAHNSVGCALRNLDRLADAVIFFREAVRLKPDFPEAYNNLGATLTTLRHPSEADACFREALRLRPGFFDAQVNRSGLMLVQRRYDDIIPHHQELLAQNPQSVSARRGLLGALPYIPGLDPRKAFEIYRSLGQAAAKEAKPQPLANDRNADRRLRIGWLSSDFSNHSVGRNLDMFFTHRDRAAFETICYADVKNPDEITDGFRRHADLWRSISGHSDSAVAEMIRTDRIDVMIYLAGRFDRNRPQIATWRPAPVQVSLFDSATSGLAEMDYFIADAVTVPAHPVEEFTERVLRLPNFYLHAPPTGTPSPGDPPSLSGGPVTFGCFHNPTKLNPKVLALWADILRRIPRARLRFKYQDLFASEELQDTIRRDFENELADRLEFDTTRDPLGQHLAQYNRIDIALDPFPFNGATATFEALWMGVPVVTLAGSAFMGRWAASMLTKVGLTELIATSPEGYAEIATKLAADPRRLTDLRHTLRERVSRSVLCDGARTTRYLERALRAVWRKWCRGGNPALLPAANAT